VQNADEREDAAPDAGEAAKKGDAVVRELMQVDRMAAFGAGDMRLARKLRFRRRQLAYLAIIVAEPVDPPIGVLAAVTPRVRPARPTARKTFRPDS
jgi:hypothetical protein